MDEKLIELLKLMNIEEKDFPSFNNVELTSLTYLKNSKKYLIKLTLKEPWKVESFKLFYDHKSNFKFPTVIETVLEDKSLITTELIEEYYEYIKETIYSYLTVLDNLKPVYEDGKIILKVRTDIQEAIILPHREEFEDYFHKLGIHVNFIIRVEKDNIYENKVIEEREYQTSKIIEKAINNDNKEKDNGPKVTSLKANNYKTETVFLKIHDLSTDEKNIATKGKIITLELKDTKSGRKILIMDITDYEDSITIKAFEGTRFTKEELTSLKVGQWIEVAGSIENDSFDKQVVLMATKIHLIEVNEEIEDESLEKRVELHLHSKMSAMDGVSSITDYVDQAVKWGHKAIAITDHNVVQAYPEAQKAVSGKPIKMLYGIEQEFSDNKPVYIFKPANIDLNEATYVIFDIETNGVSSYLDDIIEIGAVKCHHGIVLDRFQTFVDVGKPLSVFTKELTGISDEMLKGQPKLEEVINKFKDFIGDSILVAHNATFDIGFIKTAFYKYGYKLDNPVIDTLNVARRIYPDMKRYNLKALCKYLKVDYDSESAHRADYDAEVTSQVFNYMITKLTTEYEIKTHDKINNLVDGREFSRKFPYHLTILVKNQVGLKDLFKLVSKAHIDNFVDNPRMVKEEIQEKRENLLIGTACCNSEVFEIAHTKTYQELLETIDWYDYVEIQPLNNYSHLISTGKLESEERLKEILKLIIKAAKEKNKILVATGDVHYLSKREKIARTIYINSKAIGGGMHPMYDYSGRIKEYPDQHFRTTTEMLEAFAWLGEDLAYEMVITNPNKIADMIEEVKPLKDKLYTPKMEGSEEALVDLCYKTAKERYGDPLPEIVQNRIEKELKSIVGNGYAVIYYIAHKLVKKSNEDGYIVGSRGSVGSSLVANFTGITEVNALPPHYVCPNCKHSEFFTDGSVSSGFDLPPKNCPECGLPMKGDGHDIPFETFLGFKGDKVPDIDLNFSGEYQPIAHDYTKVLFGADNVYRAGTIGTVAEKTAYGYVKAYYENLNLPMPSKAELNRLASLCEGVKRTTGQHPAGIVVIPDDMDVYDFTPVNYPADDMDASWKTTHFDFHAIHDNILKLDILGHVDPTALKMLKDITGIDPIDVAVNDPDVLALFSGPEVMGVTKEQVMNETGTAGVPEFNTPFTKKMVLETKPTRFSDLVQLSGLSHGTDVWNGNAEELIVNGTCTIKSVIGCRDDIMVYLMHQGLEASVAFKIMEDVRKGKGLKPEYIEIMQANNVPSWYINSCQKIKYMFPKAHAVAYVLMALRSTWYKIHKPLHYYAVYFTTRCNIFEIETMVKGYDAIKARLVEINNKRKNHEEITNKEEEIFSTLENALEMTARGYKFVSIDIDKSDASKFIVDEENHSLIPPFITIDGLGLNVANSIINARKERPFLSKQDLMARTQINGTQRKVLEDLGVLDSLNEANQLTLF